MNNHPFHLDKWFLDFVSDDGESFIFYMAKLKYHGIAVPYTSIIHFDPKHGVKVSSRFKKVHYPIRNNDYLIEWNDPFFEIEGIWLADSNPIDQRVFDSEEGFLDWHCYQPSSEVTLKINGKKKYGRGYAEQLILTAPPWNIPMDELRWGRFGSDAGSFVWIDLNGTSPKKWLWWNSEKIQNFSITDNELLLHNEHITLKLDRSVVLESENKIHSISKNLVEYIPGFNKIMPLQFLMAEEHKWLSKGLLFKGQEIISNGYAIHELVNFKPNLTSHTISRREKQLL